VPDLSTYVAQRRALLAGATARPWTAPTYETEEDDVWTIALCGPFEHHVIHEVDPFTPDGVTHEEYDRECEGCPSCGVDEAGTIPNARAIVALVNDADLVCDVIEAAARGLNECELLERVGLWWRDLRAALDCLVREET
jgi:hypothetical protein